MNTTKNIKIGPTSTYKAGKVTKSGNSLDNTVRSKINCTFPGLRYQTSTFQWTLMTM